MKTRVWELAKELNVSTKDLVRIAQTKNIKLTHALGSVSVDEEKILKETVSLGKKTEKTGNVSSKANKKVTRPDQNKEQKHQDTRNKQEDIRKKRREEKPTSKEVHKHTTNNTANKNTTGERASKTSNRKEGESNFKNNRNNSSQGNRNSSGQGNRNSSSQGNRNNSSQGGQRSNSSSQGNRSNSSQGYKTNSSSQGNRGSSSSQGNRSNSGQGNRSNSGQGNRSNSGQGNRSNNSQGNRGSSSSQGNRSNSGQGNRTNSSQGHKTTNNQNKPKTSHGGQKTTKSTSDSNSSQSQKVNRPHNRSSQNNRTQNYRNRFGRRNKFDKRKRERRPNPVSQLNKEYDVTVPISVKDFSQAIGVRTSDIIKTLLNTYNTVATLNQSLDLDLVEAIATEFDKKIKIKESKGLEETLIEKLEVEDAEEDLATRGPVVTFLGHVDHGKTSLLDKIRNASVTEGEAGGITQHIGAYKVDYKGNPIVFLDTPGHEAFTSMRARGANVTDIVVLVVAADDGVMPQTVEAISHAKAAGVPIIVAMNKIDKEGAKPEATIQQLMKYQLIPDEWGGDTVFIKVSAISGQGIDELLEYLVLVAEMQGLQANPKRQASGTVLEAKVKDGKGSVATLLVQNGTLKRGDFVLCGGSYGRVRDISDHKGKKIKSAGPSTPIEISGLSETPEAGDKFYVIDNLSQAKSVAEDRQKEVREKSLQKNSRKLTMEDIMKQIQDGETKELNVILKADVQGSVEAVTNKLAEISHEEVKIKVLHAAVGGINETDIQLASASEALILGFGVTPSKAARDLADFKGVDIRRYNVIYHLLDDIKVIMTGMLAPEIQEKIIGHVTVRKIIRISRLGNIAGSYVTDGFVTRNSKIRVSRNGVVINKEKPFELLSLKHHKEDTGKVKSGFECGIRLHGFDDFKEGDEMEVFEMIEIKRKLE